MSNDTLMPCPKCNGEVYFNRSHIKHEIGGIEHCGRWCGLSISSFAYESEEEYLAAWNTRHWLTVVDEMIEEIDKRPADEATPFIDAGAKLALKDLKARCGITTT